jgi:hypothetical protein
MPASVVSSPTAVILTRMDESVATVPATTFSPAPFGTGFDSPVIIDSSSSASPSTISPSAGTRPPERTRTTSPSPRSSRDTFSVVPSVILSASSGRSAASASSAPEA